MNHTIENDTNNSLAVAKKILAQVMHYRRSPNRNVLCKNADCSECSSQHLPKILSTVKKNEPITFVLPGFPGKSPNPEKVLGFLPDYAERLALYFLENLCVQIKKFYAPGIRIILCSDGRVFSDVVGMKEENVTAYQIALDLLIKEMKLEDIRTFNLDHFYKGPSYDEMRDALMKSYGQTLALLKHKVREGAKISAGSDEKEANQMFRGITRFLFEDAIYPGQTKSRTAIQKEARSNAYEVIRRSNAWTALIAQYFPNAVRLSIHPQDCGSKKLGIRLIGSEVWMTPWHGVAVETKTGFVLLKRSEAEAMGAELIYDSFSRPSYYKLMSDKLPLSLEA